MAHLTLAALCALLLSVPALSAPIKSDQAIVPYLGSNVTVVDMGMGMNTTMVGRSTEDPITLDVTVYKIEECGGYRHKAMKHKQRVVENECHNFKKKFKGAWIHKDEDSPAPVNGRCWASLWEGDDCQGLPSTEWVDLVFTKKVWEYTDSTCIGNNDKVKSMRFWCKP
ncbi:hypothetical protein M409DRAFT_54076 [Zasmidium cellare ATCC 36951]|uniref:Uncharacterized protein n=1 Tax=Zasmidium cellare ATCC 36951 TaxID=1080233 RepID=A0A6A6CJS2_ZASCE|nr:uncharacterized protein M409DRAFT_54076 [Zasmidium cellare ATCC 36951]KAF2167477.1 hypothetical protein M409DRAFT_54076 [Zasmidium cellare ATCC 36951]